MKEIDKEVEKRLLDKDKSCFQLLNEVCEVALSKANNFSSEALNSVYTLEGNLEDNILKRIFIIVSDIEKRVKKIEDIISNKGDFK